MDICEWNLDHREIVLDTSVVLGRGQYSIIYKGQWRCLEVAVKKFNGDCCPVEDRVFLKKEIDILVKIHHPYIVQILGVCWEPFMIIMEYMPGGNLRQRLLENRRWSRLWSFYTKREWSVQICKALLYLHRRRPEYIIHRDLKPSNILLDKHGGIKLSDFGLSKLMDMSVLRHVGSRENRLDAMADEDRSLMTHSIGTPFFMAPEIMDRHLPVYDSRVDVWALGSTLYEIWESHLLCELVHPTVFYNGSWSPPFSSTPLPLRPLIGSCWDTDPDRRPTIPTLVEALDRLSFFDGLCWSTKKPS